MLRYRCRQGVFASSVSLGVASELYETLSWGMRAGSCAVSVARSTLIHNGRSRAELERMSQTLEHRGPDGEGFWMDGHVGLAHQRLAIIDLRAVAGQPHE